MKSALVPFCIFLLATVACTSDSAVSLPPDTPSLPTEPLLAGTGETLIDLPVGHSTAGYMQSSLLDFSSRDNDPGSPFADLFPASHGAFAPPRAKAILLDDGVSQLALVRIDAIFTTDILVEHTVNVAKEVLDLDLDGRLIISATHTHGAGGRLGTSMKLSALQHQDEAHQDGVGHGIDSFNPESVDRLARSIVAAIGQAQESLQPAALGYARGRREDANRDRRCEDEGNKDDAVRLIRVDAVDADGEPSGPIALLVNYAIHGTVYGADNRHLTTDVPGFIEFKLEERFEQPVTVMFIQGTAGDISPGGTGSGSQRMEDVGYRVAEEAYRLHEAIEGIGTAESVHALSTEIPLQTRTRRIPISHSILEYWSGEFYEDGAMLCQVAAMECREEPVSPHAVFCLSYAMEGEGKYHTDIAAASIGPLTLITLPGEAVSEIGAELLSGFGQAADGELLLVGYAQDHNGYILMPDDWLRGGYEPTITYWGWRFAPYLLQQQLDLLRELRGEDPLHKRPEPEISLPEIDFEPVAASASIETPAWETEPAAEASFSRFSAMEVTWYGGDTVLGLPRVSIEKKVDDGWAPLQFGGWRDVSNETFEMATAYSASPTYREAPWAGERTHRWAARWEIPAWVPAGTYRFKVDGAYSRSRAGQPSAYELTGTPFEVTAGPLLTTATCHTGDSHDYFQVERKGDAVQVSLAAFFPQSPPQWQSGHQEANFRLFSDRGTALFPHAGELSGSVEVQAFDGAEWEFVRELEGTWQPEAGSDKLVEACPGDAGLPHLSAAWNITGSESGLHRFVLNVEDRFGNSLAGHRELNLD